MFKLQKYNSAKQSDVEVQQIIHKLSCNSVTVMAAREITALHMVTPFCFVW